MCTISCIYFVLTPNSRSVFRAGVSLNIHSFIHSCTCASIQHMSMCVRTMYGGGKIHMHFKKIHATFFQVYLFNKEGRKCFISRCAKHMLFPVKWRWAYGKGSFRQRERKHGLHFSISSKDISYVPSHRLDSTYHGLLD